MKTMIALLISVAQTLAFASPLEERVSSYRRLLLNPNSHEIRRDLGERCSAALIEVIRSGGSFHSETLARALRPLKELRFASTPNHDSRFYHWTEALPLLDLLHLRRSSNEEANRFIRKNGVFDRMFLHPRSVPSVNEVAFFDRGVFIAEDPESSQRFGRFLLIFDLDLEQPMALPFDEKVWQDGVNEIGRRFPGLSERCDLALIEQPALYGGFKASNLFYLVAEESGAQILDYNQDGHWFQLIGPEIIRHVTLDPTNIEKYCYLGGLYCPKR